MRAIAVQRGEKVMDGVSATLFAGSVVYATSALGAPVALTAAGAGLALIACFRTLRGIDAGRHDAKFTPFDVAPLFAASMDELLLTEADRLPGGQASSVASADELVLDDILEEIGADARVVRLFDRAAMPTPGQLKARIDRHLDGASPQTAPPDASQDLYQALAELRRSLR